MSEVSTVDRVIVLGGGSAGFLAAIALQKKLPELSVRVIRSKAIGVIGVGEGSTPPMTRFLHKYIGVGEKKFFETARPTWKLGLKFIWGKRPWFHYPFGPHLEATPPGLTRPAGFYCAAGQMTDESLVSAMMAQDRAIPRAPGGGVAFDHAVLAYHFENERLVAWLEGYATGIGVEIIDDAVTEVRRDPRGAIAGLLLKSGRDESADLYVDCSGFASLLLGKTLNEPFVSFKKSLFCERAVVGGWDRTGEPIHPYTTCETMDAGWAWQIEHEHRINRGYVYSPDFTSDDHAESEFRQKNPKLGPTRIVRFVSGRYQRAWVANVVAIGNAAGFVEPLEASSLGVICGRATLLTNILVNTRREIRPTQVALFNQDNAGNWDSIRDFLALHYKFNTRLDTPFWEHCRRETDLAGAARIVDYYAENGPDPFWSVPMFGPYEAFGMAAYLALLVGMQVPFRKPTPPAPAETATWESRRRANREAAARALTVRETLALIRSPQWRWA